MALGDPDFDEFDRGGGPALERDDDDRVPRRLALPGRLPAAGARDDPRRGDRRARRDASCTSPRPRSTPTSPTSSTAAASRSGRARSAHLVDSPARRAHLRPEAPDERGRRGRRAFSRALARGRLPLRDHQLRQPRHGRPHRRHPRRGRRGRGGRPRPRRGGRGGARVRRRLHRHRRPRQRRADARARRLAQHRSLDQPGAAIVTVSGRGAARRRHPRRRRARPCWSCWGSRSPRR